MSGYKNGRLPKKECKAMLENDRKSEKSCHKKKNGPNYSMNNGLVCSRDKDKNVYCAKCKILLIPNNVSLDVFRDKSFTLMNIYGVVNCCYDCGFSWFCNKCSFMLYREAYGYFPTCFNTFALKLVNNDYNRGRYSKFSDEEWNCLREFFHGELKYKRSPKGMLVDLDFLMELIKEADYKRRFKYYRDAINNVYAKLKPCDLTNKITMEEAQKYRPTVEKVKEEYVRILIAKDYKSPTIDNKINFISKDEDTEEESESSIEV